MRIRPGIASLMATGLLLWPGASGQAQVLPEEPVTLANGRVTVAGDVSGTFSCSSAGAPKSRCGSDIGYFNYSDYEHSALRLFRLDLSSSVALGGRFVALGEVRTENADRPRVYALYLRLTPWARRRIDIQAGRIPPTFGAFSRRTYASDNPLIGYPLAYQYLTSVRPDSLPATLGEIAAMRGRGWLSSFSVASREPARGLPLVSAFAWDTGVQIHGETDRLEAAAAVTTGTLGNPLVRDDNGGRQLAGRVAVRPIIGLVAGVSAARGPFVTSTARAASGWTHGDRLTQTAWGADAEYSRGHYLVRGEAVRSVWTTSLGVGTEASVRLPATAVSVEGRYKIGPALYVAGRADRLTFGTLSGTSSDWDAAVTRVEVGGGYSLQRNLLLKASFQHNARATLYVPGLNFVATQIVVWF
jgi:hypothetical protein